MTEQHQCHFCNQAHPVEQVPIEAIGEYWHQVRDLDMAHVDRLLITGHPSKFLIHLVRRDDGQAGFWEIDGRHQLEAIHIYNQTESNKPLKTVRAVLHPNLHTSKQIVPVMYWLNLQNARAYSKADQMRFAEWLIENAEEREDGKLYWDGQELSFRFMEKMTGVPKSTLQRRFSQDGDGEDIDERRRVSEMRKFWNKAKAAYQDGKAFFSKKISGSQAGEKDIVEECRNDPTALNAAKQLAAFFNQVVEKVEREGK